MSHVSLQAGPPRVWPAAVVALALAILGAACVSMGTSMGYDESMHAELPAARMLIGVELGQWRTASDALLGCEQYPFVYPLVLSLVQAFTGVSELACRISGRVAWGIALFCLFLVAREVARAVFCARAPGDPAAAARASWAAWIALGLGALSPSALGFSGTLFLEVPFIAVAMFATYAWLRRRPAGGEHLPKRDVQAGALLALALFTKFNYGGLLAAGCALDLAVEGAQALRERALRPWLASAARIALVPLVVCLWWFVLPLPRGFALGAEHRSAFLGFLAGNQELGRVPFPQRLFDWSCGVFASPRALLVACLAALVALRFVRVPALRTLAILALVCTLPVALHPFHMDRLILPCAPYLWVLAAVGIASLLPRSAGAKLACVALLAALCLVRRDVDSHALLEWSQPPPDDSPEIAQYRAAVLAERISLDPRRSVPSAGLPRSESDAALDAIAAEVGGALRIGWLAAVEKLPPGALHVGLLARGGPKQRFLEDLAGTLPFGVQGVDPGFDDARLAAALAPFDVVLSSDPPQAFGSPSWSFLAAYRARLPQSLGYAEKDFGAVTLKTPLGKERVARLLALRRKP